MHIRQISVFLENRKGRLAEMTKLLAENRINIRAISLADMTDLGVLRLIVNDPTSAPERPEGERFRRAGDRGRGGRAAGPARRASRRPGNPQRQRVSMSNTCTPPWERKGIPAS